MATRKITLQALGMRLWRRRERQAGEEWVGWGGREVTGRDRRRERQAGEEEMGSGGKGY